MAAAGVVLLVFPGWRPGSLVVLLMVVRAVLILHPRVVPVVSDDGRGHDLVYDWYGKDVVS